MPPTPPPKNIKDLKLADISKLDLQDLQKLDYQGFLKDLIKHPDLAISVVTPVLALFIGFNMFTKSQAEHSSLKSGLVQMQEKLKIVDEYTKAQENLEKFLSALPPKVTENEFVDTITDFAVKRGVQIESFSPAKNQNDPLYDLTIINLSASTKTYENMWLFIHDIENSGFSMKINSWGANLGQQSQTGIRRNRAYSDPDDLWVNFRLEVAAVSFKKS